MASTQMNITKSIPYKTDYPIRHNKFLQIQYEYVTHDSNNLIKESAIENDDYKFYIEHSRHYPLYAHHSFLDYLVGSKIIVRNMAFNDFKSVIIGEICNGAQNWYDPYKYIMNKMLNIYGYKFNYYPLNESVDMIVKSIGSGMPVTLSMYYSIDNESEGFFNNILAYGIIRGDKGEITGVTCHDYAGNASSNYQNKNGGNAVYFGDLFKKITKNSLVGIASEES
jgi:hypothetical protein